MSGLPLKDAAAQLGVSVSTLRRWLAAGAPVVRRGRRGRGGAALVSVEAVTRWRGAQGPTLDEARRVAAAEIAAALPELLARAFSEAHAAIEGPDKKRAAGYLAGAWYLAACAVLDHLRETDPGLAEISALPDSIERLRLIAAQ